MNFKNIVLIVAGCFVLWDCKKFEDDPFISLRSVNRRLLGEWVITRVNVNGNDVTGTFNDSLNGQNFSDFKLLIGKASEISNSYGVITSKQSTTFKSNFNHDKSKIYWSKWYFMSGVAEKSDSLNLKVFNHLLIKTYTITRLYKKDLWAYGYINNNRYEIDFKKTN